MAESLGLQANTPDLACALEMGGEVVLRVLAEPFQSGGRPKRPMLQ
jgi:hypothetical protein